MKSIYSLSQLGWKPYFQHQLSIDDLEHYTIARVAVVERSELNLLTDAGSLSISVLPAMPSMAVGDWLLLDAENRFIRLLERQTWFARKAAGRAHYRQLIAANLDTVFIVSSLNQGFNLNRIERYLALAHEAKVEAVVVLTKQDLCVDAQSLIGQVQALDTMLSVVALNALDVESAMVLQPWLGQGDTVAFIGSSGVGKSTLMNTLLGEAAQSTQAIRDDDAKGRHTTSSRSMHFLPSGAVLIDTPGMREQAFNSATLAERKAEDKRFGKMVKSVMQHKRKRQNDL